MVRADNKRALQTRRTAVCLAGAGALLIAGCTVQPKPLADAERQAEAQNDLKAMFANQEPLTHPLSLQEAYARAVKYNLDRRVKVMEEVVAFDGLDVSKYDMLPKLTADAGYLNRSNVLAESSESVATGQQSLVPSTSTDSNRATLGLTLSWNILDFGVSYFAARQNANRVLIAAEHRRKVAQNLIRDVRSAFWRAASAQVLAAKIDDSIKSSEAALAASRSVESQALRAPVDALRYQHLLLDLLRQLEEVRHRLMLAKTELASLIDLPPGQDFTLATIPEKEMTYEPLKEPIDRLEQVALVRNPDLRELSYQSRISVDEVHKSILRVLPGLSFTYGPQYDSNSFLVNSWWGEGAARISWNLLYLLSAPRVIRQADDSVRLAEAQRQAVAMAVLTKLHLAYQQYLDAGKEYARARDLAQVDDSIYGQVSNRTAAQAQAGLEQIVAEVSAVASTLRQYESYSNMQAALGRIYDTVGIDIDPANLARLDAGVLTRETEAIMASWQQGVAGAEPAAPEPDRSVAPPLPASVSGGQSVLDAIGRLFRSGTSGGNQ